MSRKQQTEAAPAATTEPGLVWLGGDEPERYIPGVPARDLDQHDLAREVWKSTRLSPGEDGYAEALDKLIEGLERSQLYQRGDVEPFQAWRPQSDPAEAPATTEPSAPAEEASAPPSDEGTPA